MMKARVVALLKEGTGTRWQCQRGAKNALLYYPNSAVLKFPEQLRTTEQQKPQECCSAVLPVRERTARTTDTGTTGSEQLPEKPNGRCSPSCPACGSYAIYREPDGSTSCMTCEGKIQ